MLLKGTYSARTVAAHVIQLLSPDFTLLQTHTVQKVHELKHMSLVKCGIAK